MEHLTAITCVLRRSGSQGAQVPHARAWELGPYLQGALMELVDESYAAQLHQLPFNPYSHHCREAADGGLAWKVCALTDEAAAHVVEPLRHVDVLELLAVGAMFEVVEKRLETLPLKTLTDVIHGDGPARQRVRFVTPAAFKSQGEYVIMPSVKLMFQNLLMHYGQVYGNDKEADADTVAFIERNVRIVSYDLRSRAFPVASGDAQRVPGFTGSATLRIGGPPTMAGLVRMLLMFGEYAGIGIKTSMGMGGFERC